MAESNFFDVWGKESPETMKAFMDFAGQIQNKCGLDEKTFQLVYMGIQASRGGVGSVAAHAGFAKKAGATREEVIGTVGGPMRAQPLPVDEIAARAAGDVEVAYIHRSDVVEEMGSQGGIDLEILQLRFDYDFDV